MPNHTDTNSNSQAHFFIINAQTFNIVFKTLVNYFVQTEIGFYIEYQGHFAIKIVAK